mgnify:CR=1 FL=1
MDTEFEKVVEEIIQAIKKAGYDPYAQLYGYVTKGKEEYITRANGAREKIKQLSWLKLKEFVEKMGKSNQ